MAEQTLKNHFLIAMPSLQDPNFQKTVVYVVAHSVKDGATGIVINRETGLELSEVMRKAGIKQAPGVEIPDPVYIGGPVQTERGFVIHEPAGRYLMSEAVGEGIVFTQSRDALVQIGAGTGPAKRLFCLGYAGWLPGQLEDELARNDWLTVEADPAVIFEVPAAQRYEAALKLIGLDPEMLRFAEGSAGHA